MSSLVPAAPPRAPAPGMAADPAVPPAASLLRGAFAYGGRQVAMTVLGIAANLVLTRLLAPRDFGQIAAIMIIAGVMRVFAAGGIGLHLVQRAGSITDEELSAVRTLQFLVYGVVQVGLLAVALLAPYAGLDAELWWIIALSACGLFFGVLRSGSAVLLERRLAFGTLARIDVGEQLVNTAVVIALAVAGAGAWSVAIGGITGATVGWRLSWRAAPFTYRPHWPRLTPAFRSGLRFSGAMIAPSLIGAVRLAALPIVVGGLAGMHAAGLAERAAYIATLPFALLGGIQQRILFTYTARIQNDRAAVGRAFHDVTYISSVVDKLIYLPLVAFAPTVVRVLFSERWLEIVPTMEIVAWGCVAFGAFFSCAGPILTGLGQARVIVRLNLIMLALTWATVVPLTTLLGPLGYGLVLVLMWTSAPYIYARLRDEIGPLDLTRSTLLPLAAFVFAVAVVRHLASRWGVSDAAGVVALSAAGATLYLGCLAMTDGGRLRRLARDLLRSSRRSPAYGAVES